MKILTFGIVREIAGSSVIDTADEMLLTVSDLKKYLLASYPALGRLTAFAVAVNGSYAADETAIGTRDEIAIIPPVSGG